MKEKILGLLELATALVDYIEKEQVYDKLADAGCGYIDSYRSEKFDQLIKNVKSAAEELSNEVENLKS
jgi:hypothetical protein